LSAISTASLSEKGTIPVNKITGIHRSFINRKITTKQEEWYHDSLFVFFVCSRKEDYYYHLERTAAPVLEQERGPRQMKKSAEK